jgi:hypothetical protein
VIVGARSAATGAAYRAEPGEIDAAACFGIVQGDLARVRSWAAWRLQRAAEVAVLVGWLVAGPALVLLLF